MTGRSLSLAGTMLVVGLAGCGSTNSSGTTTNASPRLALAQCMRSHGVANFPDPNAGGGFSVSRSPASLTLTIDGSTFSGPTFEAAAKACTLFGGGKSGPPVSASQKKKVLAFARCMRTHGVPAYPDPTFPAGGGIEAKPPSGLTPSSPALQQAREACAKLR